MRSDTRQIFSAHASSGQQNSIIRFEAYDAIQPTGSGEVYITNVLADESWVTTTGTVVVYDDWSTREVAGLSPVVYGHNYYLPGECGYAIWRNDARRFEILGEHGLERLCKADAVIAKDASGTVSIYSGDTDTTQNVTAYNTWGVNKVGTSDPLIVRWFPEKGQWILTRNNRTTRGRGLIDGAITSATTNITVDNLVAYDGDGFGASSITVKNTHGWDADNNATVQFQWNAHDQQWEGLQANCPA